MARKAESNEVQRAERNVLRRVAQMYNEKPGALCYQNRLPYYLDDAMVRLWVARKRRPHAKKG